jgi:hypothetical protein
LRYDASRFLKCPKGRASKESAGLIR